MVKKFILFWIAGSVVGLYTTFVWQNLWNWFATAAFNLSPIPFWTTYGIVLLVGLLKEDIGSNFENKQWFQAVAIGIDACVPDHKQESVKQEIDELGTKVWIDAGSMIFGKIVGNSFTLLIGWGVHTFLQG
jgi:hypothetical protein